MSRRSTLVWPAYIAAIAAIVIALLNVFITAGLRSDLAGARDRIAELDSEVASHARNDARDREMMADLIAADGRHFAVPGGEVIERATRLYLAMSNIAPAPAGHVYEVWTLTRGAQNVAPGVTFVPTKSGVAVVAVPKAATTLSAVEITLEPDGGSRHPTTRPLFIRGLE
jgi:hypothetical protein